MITTHVKVERAVLTLGKVAWYGTRKVNLVEIHVELKRRPTVAPHRDIHLQPCLEALELSVCGAVWNAPHTDHISGGQNLEEIAKLFPGNKRVQRLLEIWRRWHLNDMKPGCVHQIAEKWDERRIDPSKPTNAYIDHPGGGSGWNMLTWVPRDKHPEGLLGHPCSTCGYKFGTAWLVEPLPAEVEAELRELLTFTEVRS